MIHSRLAFAAFGGVTLSASSFAIADDTKPFFSMMDFSVPHSAAQTMLGLDPSKIDSPAKLSTKAFSLLRSFGSGTIGDGFSYSMSLQELASRKLNASQWKANDFGMRLQNFTQLSMALVPGNGKDTPAKAAFGIALPLIDRTDWMTDHHSGLKADGSKAEVYPAIDQYIKAFDQVLNLFQTDVPDSLAWPSDKSASQFASFKTLLGARIEATKSYTSQLKAKLGKAASDDNLKSLTELLNKYVAASEAFLDELAKVPDNAFSGRSTTVPGLQHAVGTAFEGGAAKYGDYVTTHNNVVTQIVTVLSPKGDKVKEISEAFNEQAGNYYWNKEKLDLAFAMSWGSVDNTYNGLATTGSKAWITFNIPLNSEKFTFETDPEKVKVPTLSCVTFHGAMTNNEKTFANNAFSAGANGYEAGLRFRMGGSKNSTFVEGLYKSNGPTGAQTNTTSWSFGIEQQTQKAQWLQFSLGTDKTKAKGIFLGLGYSYNFSSARSLDFSKP